MFWPITSQLHTESWKQSSEFQSSSCNGEYAQNLVSQASPDLSDLSMWFGSDHFDGWTSSFPFTKKKKKVNLPESVRFLLLQIVLTPSDLFSCPPNYLPCAQPKSSMLQFTAEFLLLLVNTKLDYKIFKANSDLCQIAELRRVVTVLKFS